VSPDVLIREAIKRAVAYDDWFIREVEKGLAQIDAGQVLTHDAVGSRLDQKVRAAIASLTELRWTQEIAADLERIAEYLFEHTPDVRSDSCALYEASGTLLMFPNRGRLGKKEGTRELVMAPLPYIVVYTVRGDTIYIVRILHGAQQWP
jgi:toxin ParE1/3/4